MKNYKYINLALIEAALGLKQNLYTKARASYISPLFINKQINIYNGKTFKDLLITTKHCWWRLGEFTTTRNLSSRGHEKPRHLVKIMKSSKFEF